MKDMKDFMLSPTDRGIIINILKKETRGTDFEDNWVHGFSHVLRVEENFRIFLINHDASESDAKKMFLKLHIAILLHDVKRGEDGDHALNGANCFRALDLKELGFSLSEEDLEDIAFAIENHNKGLSYLGIKKAVSEKEIILGLLILFDGMDALGKTGYRRIMQWYLNQEKRVDLFGKITNNDLNLVMGGKIDFINLDLKNQFAVLPHLVFEVCVSGEVIKPVLHLISNNFYLRFLKERSELEKIIIEMMEFREDNIKFIESC